MTSPLQKATPKHQMFFFFTSILIKVQSHGMRFYEKYRSGTIQQKELQIAAGLCWNCYEKIHNQRKDFSSHDWISKLQTVDSGQISCIVTVVIVCTSAERFHCPLNQDTATQRRTGDLDCKSQWPSSGGGGSHPHAPMICRPVAVKNEHGRLLRGVEGAGGAPLPENAD